MKNNESYIYKSFFRSRSEQNKGFTLIELMVVIAVIAVLAGALMLAINPNSIVQKGRDAKRIQDIDTLAKAINLALANSEITLAAYGTSCSTCTSATGSLVVDGTGYVKFTIPTGKTGLSVFLATLPSDPTNTGNYVYRFGSTTTGFELNCAFEHPDNQTRVTTDGGNSATLYEIGTSLIIL